MKKDYRGLLLFALLMFGGCFTVFMNWGAFSTNIQYQESSVKFAPLLPPSVTDKEVTEDETVQAPDETVEAPVTNPTIVMPTMFIIGHRTTAKVVDWGHRGDDFIQNHKLPGHVVSTPTLLPRGVSYPVLKPQRFHFIEVVPAPHAPILGEPALF